MKVAFNLSETSTELKLQLPFKMFDPVLDFVLGIIREDLGESNGQQSKQLLQNFGIASNFWKWNMSLKRQDKAVLIYITLPFFSWLSPVVETHIHCIFSTHCLPVTKLLNFVDLRTFVVTFFPGFTYFFRFLNLWKIDSANVFAFLMYDHETSWFDSMVPQHYKKKVQTQIEIRYSSTVDAAVRTV